MTIPLDAAFASAHASQLSDDVAVQSLGERGRGCVATAAIPKGRCVAVCRPFATVVSHDWLKNCCALCFKTGTRSTQSCDQCRYVYYCSTSCQRRDAALHTQCCPWWQKLRSVWPHIQRQAAKRAARPSGQNAAVVLEKHHLDHLRFIVLMLIKRRQAQVATQSELLASVLAASPKLQATYSLPLTSAFLLSEPTWADFMTLQSCVTMPEGTPMAVGLLSYRKVMRCLYQILQPLLDPVLLPSERVFDGIVYREKANGFGYWDDSNTELVGYGVFPHASFFNHACAPNVRKVQQGSLMVFVTERDVAPGEELCIYYGCNQEETRSERRQRLLTHYFFDCCCTRCVSEKNSRSI